MHRSMLLVLAFSGVATAAVAQEPTRSPLTQIITLPVSFNVPVGTCTVAGILAGLARDMQFPAGIERVPGRCDGPPTGTPVEDRIHLQGSTVGEALERLRTADPRYYWVENDGVIVMRPLEAWADDEHFLNTVIERLELEDADLRTALHAVLQPLQRNRAPRPRYPAVDPVRLTLSRTAMSISEALDAIVREHGSAYWEVSYCLPERDADVATVFFYTSDKRGSGQRAVSLFDSDKRPLDRCRRK